MTGIARKTGVLLASLSLALPFAAMAQHGDDRHDDRRDGQQYNQRDNHQQNDRHDDRRGGYVRHDDWRRGRRIPPSDWNRGAQLDWRAHHLRTPPRGYEWREVDGNYVLAAAATGIIASLIIGSGR